MDTYNDQEGKPRIALNLLQRRSFALFSSLIHADLINRELRGSLKAAKQPRIQLELRRRVAHRCC